MTKKHKFDNLLKGQLPLDRVIFRPILTHFAARLNHTTFEKFASDYKTLVESNLKAIEKLLHSEHLLHFWMRTLQIVWNKLLKPWTM